MHLLSGGAAQGLVNALKPSIEKTTDTQLSCTFGAVGLMKQKLLDGAPCDVVILTAALIEQLTASGHVLAGSARHLGPVKTGVAVKSGTPWPQVETAEQLKAAMLAATGIYFPDPQLATAGIHFFGIVQYIGPERSYDWIEFYRELIGAELIPDEQRFGIMPKGTLLRTPALDPAKRFMLQLVEPPLNVHDAQEKLQRIGLGVPDVLAAVKALRALGVEFVETEAAHTEQRGAISKTYLGSVVFELVHSQRSGA